jgi:hypothetical protein
MGRTCSTYGKAENFVEKISQKPQREEKLGNLGLYRRKILRLILG